MRFLVVEHEQSCPPGWLGECWAEAGTELEVVRPYREGPRSVPSTTEGFEALVVLGCEMGANDEATVPWLAPTKQLLRAAVEQDVPTLGICLGHQLLASALGGQVTVNPAGQAGGLTPISLTGEGAGDPLLAGRNGAPSVQWNDDVVSELPPGATSLATAPDGTVQAARFAARAWGVQFHPEASPEIFDGWTVDKPSADRLRAEHVAEAATAVRAQRDALHGLAQHIAERFAVQTRH